MITIGTHSLRAEHCIQTVKLALELGYRRIDTASAYKNEHLVSEGIALSKVPRNELHITTKVGPKDTSKGSEGVNKCVEQSLANLYSKLSSQNAIEKIDDDNQNQNQNQNQNDEKDNNDNHHPYIDCVLLHWPGSSGLAPESEKHAELRREAWKVLCEYRQKGMIREIGVSNFLVRHLDSICGDDKADKTLSTNQIDVVQMELHPWCQQQEVVDWCVKHKVKRIESYGLFGGGKCLEKTMALLSTKDENVENSAESTKKTTATAAHLLLQWCTREKGYVPVVRASKKEHLEQNLVFLKERPVRWSNVFEQDENDKKVKDDEHLYWHSNMIA